MSTDKSKDFIFSTKINSTPRDLLVIDNEETSTTERRYECRCKNSKWICDTLNCRMAFNLVLKMLKQDAGNNNTSKYPGVLDMIKSSTCPHSTACPHLNGILCAQIMWFYHVITSLATSYTENEIKGYLHAII